VYITNSPDEIEQLYDEMKAISLRAKGDRAGVQVGYGAALFGQNYWRATWFCMAIGVFNQFSGCNAITIYSTTLFNNLGVSATVGSVVVGVS